jgi:hypothetical protein
MGKRQASFEIDQRRVQVSDSTFNSGEKTAKLKTSALRYLFSGVCFCARPTRSSPDRQPERQLPPSLTERR